jgi:hypothetical protein
LTGTPRKSPRRAVSKPTGRSGRDEAADKGEAAAKQDAAPVIPEQTSDDTDSGGGDWREATTEDDERYLRERPPHW